MGVRGAAALLGVTNKTVYVLIDEGELQAEITWPDGPKRRRVIRIHPAAVADYLDRARVRPGEFGDLYPPCAGGHYRSSFTAP